MRPPGLNISEEGEQKKFALHEYLGVEEKAGLSRLWCFWGGRRWFDIYPFLVCEFIPDGPFKIVPIVKPACIKVADQSSLLPSSVDSWCETRFLEALSCLRVCCQAAGTCLPCHPLMPDGPESNSRKRSPSQWSRPGLGEPLPLSGDGGCEQYFIDVFHLFLGGLWKVSQRFKE